MSADPSVPLSYANRASSLAKEQTMPMQRAPAKPAPAKKAQPPPSPSAAAPALSSPTAANGSAAAAGVTSPQRGGGNNASPLKQAAAVNPLSSSSVSSSSSSLSSAPSASSALTSPAGGSVKVVKAPRTGYALVKAVQSGDTLVVIGNAPSGQTAPEKTIIISGIQAPKFAKGKNQTDEPFAWESREYLRKKVIGQQIHFDIGYTHEDSDRHYAVVTVGGDNLAVDLLQHGWAKVKTSTSKDGKERTGPEELVAAQQEAQSAGRGLWLKGVNAAHHVRSITWQPDARTFFESARNTAIPAVVEQVRDGSTIRVELLNGAEPLAHTVIFLHLAGVQCPRTPLPLSVLQSQHESRVKEGKKSVRPQEEEAPEPWALEAQDFTELRLLHRDVSVTIQGTDKLGNYFGTIGYPKGNISIKLLELGYGRLVPWSAALTPEQERLRQAEAVAKQKKLRVWSGAAADDGEEKTASGAAAAGPPSDYQGKVVQVVSGDSLLVSDADGVERKVSLASVRAPRLGRRGERDEPFALEAKEFMRSRLVGHKVKLLLEYSRPPPADSKDQDERRFVTVFQGKLNMNEALLAAGLAEVIRHRVDEERSQFYDAYLSAEHAAEEAHRGRFGKQAASAKLVDLTDKPRPDRRRKDEAAAAAAAAAASAAAAEDGAGGGDEEAAVEKKVDPREEERLSKAKALTAKARTYLSFFQRDKNVSAVVEYVFTPSRFKLAVPKESVLISFALGGVRTPGSRDAEGKPEPLFEKALQFVRSRVLQHTVRIEVDALDKGDNFLGSLFIGRLNLAVELLKEGLASLVEFSARKSPHSAELFAAEAEAKQAKRGQWENYVPQPDEEKKDGQAGGADSEAAVHAADSGEAKDQLVGVKVTEIEDANDFYVHFSSDKGVELVESKLRDFGSRQAEAANSGGGAEAFTPHHGSIAAGQFNDGNWYRVRIESSTAAGDFRVFFLDYGNHDTLPADKVRPLPLELTKLAALAHHATLAGIAAPKGEDYRDAAALAFNDAVWGQELQAKVELVGFDKLLHLTLTHDSSPVSINKQLLRDGNARVVSRPAAASIRQLLPELLEHQEFAKQNHYNIWEYGDVSDDEDDTAKPQQPAAAAQRKK